jgi:hypothetical protein
MALFDISLQSDKPTSVEGVAPKLALCGSRRISELIKKDVPLIFGSSRSDLQRNRNFVSAAYEGSADELCSSCARRLMT